MFFGEPEHVINYLYVVAEELRSIMAELGFRTLEEMVGAVEHLKVRSNIDHWKARHLDLSPILTRPDIPHELQPFQTSDQDHGLDAALDHILIKQCAPALEHRLPVSLDVPLKNVNRTVGTMLSGEIARRYGDAGLPQNTITLNCTGSAGQSFMAFGAPGMVVRLEGDANDYVGKGLSGARLIITPPKNALFVAEENILIGNVAMYGATSGEVYVRGRAGERFCVRNSGVRAVVEGVGDHGCEYMTGGRAVVLGSTGRNFAAGMSGGIAYVLDLDPERVNGEMDDLDPLDEDDREFLRDVLDRHREATGSGVAAALLADFGTAVDRFGKGMPRDYQRVLTARAEAERAGRDVGEAIMASAAQG